MKTLKSMSILATVIIALAGCSTGLQHRRVQNGIQTAEFPPYTGLQGTVVEIPPGRVNSLPRKLAQDGIEELTNGNLLEASKFFNQALMYDPSDSHLQLLNGVAYHLLAAQGESAKSDLAAEAYRLAIQFDPSNWRAIIQLGLLHTDNHDYAAAQEAFAEALMFRPDDPDLLYYMVYVSYYAYDPQTAAASFEQLRRIEPNSKRTLNAAPMIMAALGDQAGARAELANYQTQTSGQAGSENISRRVQDWGTFYDYRDDAALVLASADVDSMVSAPEPATPAMQAPADAPEGEMVIVDVAIIESTENTTTRKGVNLLNGLKIQYHSNLALTDQHNSVVSGTTPGTTPATITDSFSRNLTNAISIPQLEYSLNIFNSAFFHNEILARPTLAALNGQKSRFFAGSNVQAASTANNPGSVGGGYPVRVQEDIGVDLSITPTLRDDGLVKVDVEITRTFLEIPNTAIQYDYILQTSKVHVSASVVMAFGETLILSGLSEKETESYRDGVPFLQDIPIVQYLFSEKATVEYLRSVLVLITPRRPLTLNAMATAAEAGERKYEDDPVAQLKQRYKSWFKPTPHWGIVMEHLAESKLCREFRTGDLELEVWAESTAFRRRFSDVIGFLYY